ncbi:MAG: DUF4097 family beta strand repeat-containing protein [Solibacillus sp.]
MQNERERILKLLEDGKITADEAVKLLDVLAKQNESTTQTLLNDAKEQTDEDSRKKTGFEDLFGKDTNKKMDEFMNDLKDDLSQFSTRMVGLLNSTFSKVKEFDFDTPFGEKLEFDTTYAYPATEVSSFYLEVANGKVDVVKSADDTVQVDVHVKTSVQGTAEETEAKFTDDLVTLRDGKLEIASDNKFAEVKVRIAVAEKHYDVFVARLLSGSVAIEDLDAKLIKIKTLNGLLRLENVTVDHAELKSANGAIEARNVVGADIEAETVNGRIYIDGDVKEVEAESVNGHVVVTTKSEQAHKIKARTVAGAVELYVPKTVALDGRVMSNFGKADVGLGDIVTKEEEEQFLLKTTHFTKQLEGASVLKLVGESRTGTVLVRYTTLV